VRQQQFHICWQKGSFNKADCFSKHHPTAHHQQLLSTCLHELASSNHCASTASKAMTTTKIALQTLPLLLLMPNPRPSTAMLCPQVRVC
jgi:hypothetical protein